MTINLLMLSSVYYGGMITWVMQVSHALRSVGCKVRILRLAKKTRTTQEVEEGGFVHFSFTFDDMMSLDGYKIIVAHQKDYVGLINLAIMSGVHIVVHDSNELRLIKQVDLSEARVVVVREAMKEAIPHAAYIPQAYQRLFPNVATDAAHFRGVCLSRIAGYKNIPLILDANRLVDEKDRVHLVSQDGVGIGWFQMTQKYPELKERKLKINGDVISNVFARRADFVVNLTAYPPPDGGGEASEFAVLEGIDAGAVIVVHRKWLRQGGELIEGVNCLAVDSAPELADLLRKRSLDLAPIRNTAYRLLDRHAPSVIGQKWKHHFQHAEEF